MGSSPICAKSAINPGQRIEETGPANSGGTAGRPGKVVLFAQKFTRQIGITGSVRLPQSGSDGNRISQTENIHRLLAAEFLLNVLDGKWRTDAMGKFCLRIIDQSDVGDFVFRLRPLDVIGTDISTIAKPQSLKSVDGNIAGSITKRIGFSHNGRKIIERDPKLLPLGIFQRKIPVKIKKVIHSKANGTVIGRASSFDLECNTVVLGGPIPATFIIAWNIPSDDAGLLDLSSFGGFDNPPAAGRFPDFAVDGAEIFNFQLRPDNG